MIELNAIQCLQCFDVIESTFTHDFKYCSCEAVSVDGGHAYLRRSWTLGAEYVDISAVLGNDE